MATQVQQRWGPGMTSTEQIEANRKTVLEAGPCTTSGKARPVPSVRHGLTINILKDPAMGAEAQTLARALAGPSSSPARLDRALAIAQARLELRRIREAQLILMESIFSPPMPRAAPVNAGLQEVLESLAWQGMLEVALRWHDYERKILSRLKRAMREFLAVSND